MFRSLFGSLFTSRPQTRTRSQVSFKPQLEALEHRWAPSHTGGSGFLSNDNVVVNVDLNNTNAVTAINSPGAHQTTILIGQNDFSSSGHEHHKES